MPSAIEAAPIIGRAFRKVKSAMQDNHAKLRSAVAEVEKLEASRQKILQEISMRFDTSRFEPVVASARSKFEKEGTIEAEVNMILMQLVANEVSNRVAPLRFARMRAGLSGGASEEWATFENRHPQWRVTLREACQCKVGLAKESLQETLTEVGRQLAGKFDVEDDQRVGRARRELDTWEGAVERCTSEKDGERFWRGIIGRFCQEHE
jgi:hypothetical protein